MLMNAKDIKIGDILDAYIDGEKTQRVMVIEIGVELVYGISSENEEYAIVPRSEVERVIVNINDL